MLTLRNFKTIFFESKNKYLPLLLEKNDNNNNKVRKQEKVKELIRNKTLTVLAEMKDQGYITDENEYNAAVAEVEAGLSIARALLADAPVMILDEATSALDVATERRVLRQIIKKEPNRTVIVAAHRPSVFSMCSRVYKVGDHRIEEVDEAGIREFLDAF